jgi:hypothetical protein
VGRRRIIKSVLYQQATPPFWQRHPWFTGAAAFVACWLLIHGWYAALGAAAVVGLTLYIGRRRRASARRDGGLRARAEWEHRLSLIGDPRGLYGRYPPVQPGWFPDPTNPRLLRYFDGSAWTAWSVGR